MKTESVLDFPKDTLCPDIWEQGIAADGMREVWCLKPEVETQLHAVIEAVLAEAQMGTAKGFDVHIAGSITSNSYTKNADIDLHIQLKDGIYVKMRAERVQDIFRAAFETVKRRHPELASVGSHPIEVYYQPNKYQDYMSVGCYDFFTAKWLVGPEFTDPSFNPYSEYYKEIQAHAEHMLSDVRSQVLDTYEKAVVFQKVANGTKRQCEPVADIYAKTAADMQKSLAKSVSLYDSIRQTRKAYSTPESKEQALQYRSNRRWKVADATFKLLDKFGYLMILKKYKELNELLGDDPLNGIAEEAAHSIIMTAKDGIGNADKLAEKEKAKVQESLEHKKQLMALFESWDPSFEDKPKNQYGEAWHLIEPNHWIYSKLHQIADECQLDPTYKEPKVDRLSIQSVHEVEDEEEPYYIAVLFGGANGGGGDRKWLDYLALIKKALGKMNEVFADLWLIDLTNDCCDDLWTLQIAFKLHPEPEQAAPVAVKNVVASCECEDEKQDQDAELDEGVKGAMSIGLLASLLAFPGIMPAEAAQKILKKAPTYQKANEELSKASGSAGKYSEYYAADIIARTLYAEAQEDGYEGFMAVASVIYNRSEGKRSNFAIACLSPKQFSCWNAMTPKEKDPAEFKTKIPKNTIDNKANNRKWEQCKTIAADMIRGKFKPTLKTANSYYSLTRQKTKPDWDKDLKDVKIVGTHKFGYVKNHSDFLAESR